MAYGSRTCKSKSRRPKQAHAATVPEAHGGRSAGSIVTSAMVLSTVKVPQWVEDGGFDLCRAWIVNEIIKISCSIEAPGRPTDSLAGRGLRPNGSRLDPDPDRHQLAVSGVRACSRLGRVALGLVVDVLKAPASPSPIAFSDPRLDGWALSARHAPRPRSVFLSPAKSTGILNDQASVDTLMVVVLAMGSNRQAKVAPACGKTHARGIFLPPECGIDLLVKRPWRPFAHPENIG